MKRKLAIVTGAGRGLGREVALSLAKAGWAVVMACRNPAAALPVRDELAALSGNPDLEVMEVDLASLASVRAFAAAFLAQGRGLDALVNNAGITSRERRLSPDGHELVVATNYLGPCLLTLLLLPALGRGGRIVNLTSNIHGWGAYRLDSLDSHAWVRAYAVSKLCVLVSSLALARALEARGITVNAVHPGVVKTGIMFTGRWYDILIEAMLRPLYVGLPEGGQAISRLVLDPGLAETTGAYFSGLRAARPSALAGKPAKGRDLLAATAAILGPDALAALDSLEWPR